MLPRTAPLHLKTEQRQRHEFLHICNNCSIPDFLIRMQFTTLNERFPCLLTIQMLAQFEAKIMAVGDNMAGKAMAMPDFAK